MSDDNPSALTTNNLGFLLAKATQRWNDLLADRFAAAGFGDVRPAFGSILLPLYEDDGQRISELARRAQLSKQTMTTLIRAMQQRGLIRRTPDPRDGRAYRIRLTARARRFQPIAERVAGDLEQMVADRLAPSDLAQLRMTLRVMGASRAPATERTA